MGLSIHYSGCLRKAESLPSLIEEVKDISDVYGWKYHKIIVSYFERLMKHIDKLKKE